MTVQLEPKADSMKQQRVLGECYWCAEDNAKWCKICQQSFCKDCHKQSEECYINEEYLSPHEFFGMDCSPEQVTLKPDAKVVIK